MIIKGIKWIFVNWEILDCYKRDFSWCLWKFLEMMPEPLTIFYCWGPKDVYHSTNTLDVWIAEAATRVTWHTRVESKNMIEGLSVSITIEEPPIHHLKTSVLSLGHTKHRKAEEIVDFQKIPHEALGQTNSGLWSMKGRGDENQEAFFSKCLNHPYMHASMPFWRLFHLGTSSKYL